MTNPFYWLEIRIRASEKRLWIIALFFLVSILLIGGGILALAALETNEIVPGSLGQGITYTLLFWHGAMLVVLGPLASAGRISQEREQRTLPALINTHVRPSKIVWGKLTAAWVFILWLSSLVLPFLGIGVIWGGMPAWKVVAFVAINITVSLVLTAVALGFSGVMRRSLSSYLVTGAFMLAWILVLPIVGGISMAIAENIDHPLLGRVMSYVGFYSNPFFPTIMIATEGMSMEPGTCVTSLVYCFSVWVILAFLGFMMACRGLNRELY